MSNLDSSRPGTSSSMVTTAPAEEMGESPPSALGWKAAFRSPSSGMPANRVGSTTMPNPTTSSSTASSSLPTLDASEGGSSTSAANTVDATGSADCGSVPNGL